MNKEEAFVFLFWSWITGGSKIGLNRMIHLITGGDVEPIIFRVGVCVAILVTMLFI